MLIYLDANLVQYCADYVDYIFGDDTLPPVNARLYRELEALRQIVDLEQLGEGWHVAAPRHLMQELLRNRDLTPEQRNVYSTLLQTWQEVGCQEAAEAIEEKIVLIEQSIQPLRLRHGDRRHLAEAIALEAVWFLTNDTRLINHTRSPDSRDVIHNLGGVCVARPSECIPEISKGLFLGTDRLD